MSCPPLLAQSGRITAMDAGRMSAKRPQPVRAPHGSEIPACLRLRAESPIRSAAAKQLSWETSLGCSRYGVRLNRRGVATHRSVSASLNLFVVVLPDKRLRSPVCRHAESSHTRVAAISRRPAPDDQNRALQDMRAAHHDTSSIQATRVSLNLYCTIYGDSAPIDGIYGDGSNSSIGPQRAEARHGSPFLMTVAPSTH